MKKFLGRIFILAASAWLVLATAGCHWIESVPPVQDSSGGTIGDPVTSLTLGKTEITLYQTATLNLNVEVSPSDMGVIWSSGDGTVASVENGVVTGISPGQTVITATTSDGKATASCSVTVIPLPELTVQNNASKNIDADTLSALKNLIAKNPLSLSLYYKDLNSGTVIEYNSGRKFQAGSVTKAPYIKWLIASGADLAEQLTLRSEDILKGAGEIQNNPTGTAFTVEELIREALVNSDNTAYNMLCNRYGFEGFQSYAQSLGNSANQSSANVFGSMSAQEAARFFEDIYFWGQNSPEQSELFLTCLKNTSYTKLINAATDSIVAHKYGFNGGYNGFHDAAIVYSANPYILTIFTTLDPDNAGTEDYITSVAACLDKINLS